MKTAELKVLPVSVLKPAAHCRLRHYYRNFRRMVYI